MKRFLAVLLAVLLVGGALGLGAGASDLPKPRKAAAQFAAIGAVPQELTDEEMSEIEGLWWKYKSGPHDYNEEEWREIDKKAVLLGDPLDCLSEAPSAYQSGKTSEQLCAAMEAAQAASELAYDAESAELVKDLEAAYRNGTLDELFAKVWDLNDAAERDYYYLCLFPVFAEFFTPEALEALLAVGDVFWCFYLIEEYGRELYGDEHTGPTVEWEEWNEAFWDELEEALAPYYAAHNYDDDYIDAPYELLGNLLAAGKFSQAKEQSQDLFPLIAGVMAKYGIVAEHLDSPWNITPTPDTTLTDKNITITGTIPTGTALVVTEQSSESVANAVAVYDISLKKDSATVQPNGTVTVKLPIPAGADKAKLKVYRVEAGGSRTDMSAKVEGEFLVFTTDHFSVYAIVADNSGAANPNGGAAKETWWTKMATWLKILLGILTLGIVPLIGILTSK